MVGCITKYFAEKGYGFIKSYCKEQKDTYFFHISSVQGEISLEQETTVEFDIEETEKGLAAKNIEEVKITKIGGYIAILDMKDRIKYLVEWKAIDNYKFEKIDCATICDGKYIFKRNRTSICTKEELEGIKTVQELVDRGIYYVQSANTFIVLKKQIEGCSVELENIAAESFAKKYDIELYVKEAEENKGSSVNGLSYEVVINYKKNTDIAEIQVVGVIKVESETYQSHMRQTYYGSLYENFFSKSTSHSDMYPTGTELKTYRSIPVEKVLPLDIEELLK